MGEERPTKPIHVRWPLFLVAFVAAFLLLDAFWPKGQPPATDGRLHVVCTFLPMYVFTQNVVGDTPGVDVQLLIDRDVGCPHTYSLTGQDLKRISQADVVVANGLGIEPFLDQVLRGRKDLKLITIADDCQVLRLKPGEADEDEHDHATGSSPSGATGSLPASASALAHDHVDSDVNPHTWVSPRQAIREVRTLARKLGEADPARAERYRANADAYTARLEALAQRMETAAQGFTRRNIVTGHPAFDYLAHDLGLNVVATLRVIPGETGSAAEMAHVIDTIRRTQAAAVFWEPPFADKVADTIARDAGVPVYPLNPFNTDAGLPKPKTLDDTRRMYEDVMNRNLETLERALGTVSASKPARPRAGG